MVVPVCYFRAIPMGGMAEGHDDKRRSFIQLAKLSSIGLEMGVAAGFKGVYAAAREAVQRTRDAKD